MKRALLSLLFLSLACPLVADEGMWLFNQPPRQILHKRYGFDSTHRCVAGAPAKIFRAI